MEKDSNRGTEGLDAKKQTDAEHDGESWGDFDPDDVSKLKKYMRGVGLLGGVEPPKDGE